jgi:3-phosphoshikimate 1-carboxyvinyltransferase
MKLTVKKTEKLEGEIEIPSSKSHTIRAVIFASLAEGTSKVVRPLESEDTLAAFEVCKELGAEITKEEGAWIVKGFNKKPKNPEKVLDLKNSGTSLRLISSVVALGDFEAELDGDESLRTRPMQPLLSALNNLGAEALSDKNDGKCPIKIKGPLVGGKTDVGGVSSQFVSSLLITCPLLSQDTEIEVVGISEIPYIKMTLQWLDEQGIKYEKSEDLTKYKINGNQSYKSFEKTVPADWSSAAFPICAAVITNSNVLIKGLDVNDVQGDKGIIGVLKQMGADITVEDAGIRVKGSQLKGTTIDLNSMPDALPALSVVSCFAEGETIIKNVSQARIKETDRIKAMATELRKMGANAEEFPDGMIIRKSELKGVKLRGYKDHRIVMALSLAGMAVDGKTQITTAEAINVTFPSFVEAMKKLGAQFELV